MPAVLEPPSTTAIPDSQGAPAHGWLEVDVDWGWLLTWSFELDSLNV